VAIASFALLMALLAPVLKFEFFLLLNNKQAIKHMLKFSHLSVHTSTRVKSMVEMIMWTLAIVTASQHHYEVVVLTALDAHF
jgi:hypothetical protein